jgi:hypothetical protein
MLEFLNDNTIEDKDTGIIVQIYTNPVPLQDYYPYEDVVEKDEYMGDKLLAVWLNEDEKLYAKARIILRNALDYYIAFKEK